MSLTPTFPSTVQADEARTEIAAAADALGFGERMDPQYVRDVRRLPVKAGLYVLGFANGEYYVGRSTHLRNRILTHMNTHRDIAWVCFQYIRRSALLREVLMAAEADVISAMHARLHAKGIATRGVDRVPWTPQATPLDSLIAMPEQRAWITDPTHVLADGVRPARHADAASIADKFSRLSSLPEWPSVREFLATYATRVIPRPRATEVRYWMTSCYPKGGSTVRLNVGWQTTVDVFLDEDGLAVHFYVPSGVMQLSLGIDQAAIWPDVPEKLCVPLDGGGSLLVKQEAIRTVKGGAKQVWLIMTIPDALRFMASSKTLLMLRQFCVGLMQQGQVPSPFSHCTAIADAMLGEHAVAVIEHDAAPDSQAREFTWHDEDIEFVEPVAMSTHTEPRDADWAEPAVAVIAGRWRLFEKLASGGQGEVWRGQDAEGAPVAVKLLPRPQRLADREDRAARFDDEAKSGRLVRGPHVVAVLDAGEVARVPELGLTYGAHFMAMEYVGGGNLLDLYDATDQFESAQLRALARAMVNALASAHELMPPIVHRDVKPENILLPDGDVARAKLTDFGISRQEGDTALTTVGSFIGSVPYMAPEQFASSSEVTAAADQYSLALVLWEFAMDEIPGWTETVIGTRRVRARGIRLGTFEVDGRRRRSVERVLAKALSPAPEDRYASVREFGEAFDAAGIKDKLWRN